MENNATRQLQTLALPKNWDGKEEREIFSWTPQLISLLLQAWGSFRWFFLVAFLFVCFFVLPGTALLWMLFQFLAISHFFPNPLKSGNAKLWHTFKRIAHAKECRELYLCPQMHSLGHSFWIHPVIFLSFCMTESYPLCILASRFNSLLHWPEWNHLQIS